jgi:NHLM bacteriocin system secretion protein
VAWLWLGSLPTTVQGQAILMRKGSVHRVLSDQPGMLRQFLVSYGAQVQAGQVVARMQSSQSPNVEDVKALYDGVVVKKAAAEGDLVDAGATLLVLEPTDPTLEVVAFLPLSQGKQVHAGMTVQVSPSTTPKEVYGYLVGTVRHVSTFPAVESGMLDTLGSDELVKYFLSPQSNTPAIPLEIRVDLVRNSNTPSGYQWSSSQGPPRLLSPQTLCTATVVLSSERPLSMLIPSVTAP